MPQPNYHPLQILLLVLLLHPSYQQNTLNPTDYQALYDIKTNLKELPGSSFFSSWTFNNASSPCTSFSGITCTSPPSSSTLKVSVLKLSAAFIGTLSNSILNLTSLTELVIFPGKISGHIPPQLGIHCPKLLLISISNNLFSGSIPLSLSDLVNLHTLDLSHNNLTGTIPANIFSLPNLKFLILSSNTLSGSLPDSLSYSTLYHIDLRKNSFSGTLPALAKSLCYISISENSFSGAITSALSTQPQNLTWVDLSMNKFAGNIPSLLFALPNVSTMLLHRNCFSGPVTMPGSNTRSTLAWSVVDLSHNMLSGEVPGELGQAKSLFLNSNKFSGAVPSELVERVNEGEMSTFYAQHNYLTGFGLRLGKVKGNVTLCLAYNCMDLSEVMSNGCPAGAGSTEARPKQQCPGGG